MNLHDTVVIGGGPAGAAAAIELARAGQRVSLLEREKSPHDKVCGEFISWDTAYYLALLGVDLKHLGAQPIRRLRLCSGATESETRLPFNAWSLSRRRLDEALLEQAEQCGAEIHRGVAVRGLQEGSEGWVITTAESRFVARNVFLATGKRDLRQWRRPVKPENRDLIGLKMHLRLQREQQRELRGHVEVFLYDGGYAGLEPVEDGKANLCFLLPKARYKSCNGSWPGILQWLCGTSPLLERRLVGCRSLWSRPLAVHGTPYGFLHPPGAARPGLFRLGDQTAVIPSFAGDGMAIALHSGFLAARACLSGSGSRRYQHQAHRAFRSPVRRARLLSNGLQYLAARKAAVTLARAWPAVLTRSVSLTRLQADQLVGDRVPAD
ncbi:NAD(P)/FAD-dependent oxidoreductase [Marinobacter zhanjiangensis]|uniref:Protein CbrA n=1 Tax=Marinobacter zhanjiangensis TaxID=578215 RepID=A0ABQ3AN56_9GAMM|nr:FAD-dependent oxidoreductase [Marinobacter zhanjiangensis]GGY61274.1 FAD-dependent oxidoreductase [Marinobacter zhanjiangensis]